MIETEEGQALYDQVKKLEVRVQRMEKERELMWEILEANGKTRH